MTARSVLFALYLWVSALVLGVFCAPALLRRDWSLAVSKLWARSVLGVLKVVTGLGYEVEGATNLPKGPALVAARHSSMWETFALTHLLERPCFVLKKELASIPVFAWYCKANGFVFVDRGDGARALRSMTAGARRAAGEGAQIVIFPEGSRAGTGEELPFHPGVAALARATGLDVTPIAHDASRYWERGLLRRPGTIKVRILPPVPANTPRKTLVSALKDVIGGATRQLETTP